MKKNVQLNQWLWKWHVIGGLVSLPFILLLAVTGVVYLFKADLNKQLYQSQMFTTANTQTTQPISYTKQLAIASEYAKLHQAKIVSVTLPKEANQTTEFRLKGKGHARNNVYVDPYTSEIKGQVNQHDTFMYLIRKLHGEVLLDKVGTLTIELIASWFIVLILTGIYVWWPKGANGSGGFFAIRTNQGRRVLWRDIHAVTGFWVSLIMLAVVAGGMPWTDVFGSQLKWVQAKTDTGYPKHWRVSKGLESVQSSSTTKSLELSQIVDIANTYQLAGQLTIKLPNTPTEIVSISNRALWLEDQQVIHLNQYSGQVIKSYTWQDVGILMELRQIFMRLHQGEYGAANWWFMLFIGVLFIVSTTAGLVSYLYRKKKGSWSIPKVPARFNVDKVLVVMIIALGLLFPMFGGSLIVLWLWEQRNRFSATKPVIPTNIE